MKSGFDKKQNSLSKKIVFTGPESTGKTELSIDLAQKLGALHISEFARTYLDTINRPYDLSDLQRIEEGQKKLEQKALHTSSKWIVQDTDFLTIWIWYGYKFGLSPRSVSDYLNSNPPKHYFLCYPDIEWQYDELRENEHDRFSLFDCYVLEIEDLGVPYTIVKGEGSVRMKNVMNAIQVQNILTFEE